MFDLLTIYAIIGFCWALFAVYMQFKKYPACVEWWRVSLVLQVNFLIWPIAAVVALIRGRAHV